MLLNVFVDAQAEMHSELLRKLTQTQKAISEKLGMKFDVSRLVSVSSQVDHDHSIMSQNTPRE